MTFTRYSSRSVTSRRVHCPKSNAESWSHEKKKKRKKYKKIKKIINKKKKKKLKEKKKKKKELPQSPRIPTDGVAIGPGYGQRRQ
jgi:hypothetical protein